MSELRLPGYDDIELVGEGGLGRVFRATRASTGGLVAIKELRDVPAASPAWHRARRELGAMLRLKGHAGVTSVEEILDGPNGPCIVMEYVSGGSLHDRLVNSALSLPEVVLVGRQVAEALSAAHDAGIVHRDVKPHNLLVSSFGQVKVCDFGISALARDLGGGTRTNAMTLAYASPEELDESPHIGPPADVYSLAATLQHLVTGVKPSFGDRMAGAGSLRERAATAEPVERSVLELLDAGQATHQAARPTMPQMVDVFDRAGADLGDRRLSRLVVAPQAPRPSRPPVRPPAPPPPPTRARLVSNPSTQTLSRPSGPLPATRHRGAVEILDAPPPRRKSRRNGRVAAGAFVAIAAAASVLTVPLLTRGGSDDDPASTKTDAAATGSVATPAAVSADSEASATVAPTTVVVTQPAATSPRTTVPPATVGPTAAAVDAPEPGAAAQAELSRLVALDRTFVNTNLLGAFVVQLGGKTLDEFDEQDMVVYDAKLMVAKYNELTARFGRVAIIRQDEYNHATPGPGLYQFLVGQPFGSKSDGTDWCSANGLAVPDQCFARDRLRTA